MRKFILLMTVIFCLASLGARDVGVLPGRFKVTGDHLSFSSFGASFSAGPVIYGSVGEKSFSRYLENPWRARRGINSIAGRGISGKRAVSFSFGDWSILSVPGKNREITVSYAGRYISAALGYRSREEGRKELVGDWTETAGGEIFSAALETGFKDYMRVIDTVSWSYPVGIRNHIRVDMEYDCLSLSVLYGDIVGAEKDALYALFFDMEENDLRIRLEAECGEKSLVFGTFTPHKGILEWSMPILDWRLGIRREMEFRSDAERDSLSTVFLSAEGFSFSVSDEFDVKMMLDHGAFGIGANSEGTYFSYEVLPQRLRIFSQNGKPGFEIRVELP